MDKKSGLFPKINDSTESSKEAGKYYDATYWAEIVDKVTHNLLDSPIRSMTSVTPNHKIENIYQSEHFKVKQGIVRNNAKRRPEGQQ